MATVKTAVQVQPYVFFNGRCEEAMQFYKTALGAQVGEMMRFGQSPESCEQMPPGREDKIMHGEFTVGESTILVSDGMHDGAAAFNGFSLTISVPDATTAEKMFAALQQDGKVEMPLGKTFFAPLFGMVTDKFGMGWMIIVQHEG
jgi:PhnB protein